MTGETYSLAKTPLNAAHAPLAMASSIHRFPRSDAAGETMAEVSSAGRRPSTSRLPACWCDSTSRFFILGANCAVEAEEDTEDVDFGRGGRAAWRWRNVSCIPLELRAAASFSGDVRTLVGINTKGTVRISVSGNAAF
jgi:hypothetical protein